MRLLLCVLLSCASLCFSQDIVPAPEENALEPTMTYQGAFLKMMLTLLALIILIVITVWLLRRISHGRLKHFNSGKAIKILERRPLSAKSILYLIQIEDKKMVIAESQLEVRPIVAVDESSIPRSD
ncbi:MAG: flagellar biosynthetic protein FliO [Chlamydiae bacterium]|nr:flagellar biosynthetic protein FliO [Chlamydiota bacterium]